MAAPNMAADSAPDSKVTMMKLENTEKRDTLIEIEKRYQQQWQDNKVFEANAPSTSEISYGSMSYEEMHEKFPKFFGTSAFPYMNGTPHAGHSFTISKVEFTAGFKRMEGKRVLFPWGYHCTGMPIKACADKLVDEVNKFGKDFSGYNEEEEEKAAADAAKALPAPTQAQTKDDVTKFVAKKGKTAAKTLKAKYQFQIMLSLGIPREELYKFADPAYWLQYFPPQWRKDLIGMGARIDWRRQFVTTDANPYFDAFVRWQMNRLHELKKIRFGARYTIYSPKDGQPCMDHDRSKGEAIIPQEYTALKLKVKEWAPKALEIIRGKIPSDANVYFVPATLRPETMYGQTCCFVGPKIVYGAFKVAENDYYIFTKRAAWNLAFQGTFFDSDHFAKHEGELQPVAEFSGSDVVGTLVLAPLSIHTQGVRILPMESVLPTKGTGVVTSVPSDSPDDYATIRELAKKAEYYGIQKEWAEFEIAPIINTPSYGNLCAKFLVEKLKISSPKDAKALAEAKDLAYKEGYYKGTMLVGEYKGETVEAAKPKVRDALIKEGLAFAYAEPAGQVISRSGDECIVAYLGQWFLNYGDDDAEWKGQVIDYVHSKDLELYNSELLHAFEGVLGWLNKWACARSFGLGSRLPWDPKFLVESLSDSTVYMAYYTVKHYLHSDMFGATRGIFNIKPEQLTDEVWDAIFARRDLDERVVQECGIPKSELETMRREFEYWYPLDMRGSGKDLIPNHLTFFLYVHIALFPKHLWPRSIRANGHLLLNGDKMSKSTGNFLTLNDSVEKFGADATRVAFADGGDGVEDANFDETVANSNILRLYTLKEWCEDAMKDDSLRTGPSDNLFDRLFDNEMNELVEQARSHYEKTDYKLALRSAFYDFIGCRDFYREAIIAGGLGLSKDLVARYIELQALLLTPITPHWSDYMWQEVLHKKSTIQNALWPSVPKADPSLTAAREYVRSTSSSITSAESAQLKKKSKGKTLSYDPKAPKKLTIFAAAAFPQWQEKYVELVREHFEAQSLGDGNTIEGDGHERGGVAGTGTGTVGDAAAKNADKDLVEKVSKMGETKKAMPFVQGLRRKLEKGEKAAAVFDRRLAFDEVAVLKEMVKGLKKTTGCRSVEVIYVDEGGKAGRVVADAEGKAGGERRDLPLAAEAAVPGVPSFHFENVEG